MLSFNGCVEEQKHSSSCSQGVHSSVWRQILTQGMQSTHKHMQNGDGDKYEGGGPSCSIIMVTSPMLQNRRLKFLNITLEDVLQRELFFTLYPYPLLPTCRKPLYSPLSCLRTFAQAAASPWNALPHSRHLQPPVCPTNLHSS